MLPIGVIWFTLHSVILITLFFVGWFLYSDRDSPEQNMNISDYLWRNFTFYMWLTAVLFILWPLALVWAIFGFIQWSAEYKTPSTTLRSVNRPTTSPIVKNTITTPRSSIEYGFKQPNL